MIHKKLNFITHNSILCKRKYAPQKSILFPKIQLVETCEYSFDNIYFQMYYLVVNVTIEYQYVR